MSGLGLDQVQTFCPDYVLYRSEILAQKVQILTKKVPVLSKDVVILRY